MQKPREGVKGHKVTLQYFRDILRTPTSGSSQAKLSLILTIPRASELWPPAPAAREQARFWGKDPLGITCRPPCVCSESIRKDLGSCTLKDLLKIPPCCRESSAQNLLMGLQERTFPSTESAADTKSAERCFFRFWVWLKQKPATGSALAANLLTAAGSSSASSSSGENWDFHLRSPDPNLKPRFSTKKKKKKVTGKGARWG